MFHPNIFAPDNRSGLPDRIIAVPIKQSNGVGQADATGQPAHPPLTEQLLQAGTIAPADSPLDHFNRDEPEFGFDLWASHELRRLNDRSRILWVPCCNSGTGFSDNRWNPGDDLYNQTVSRVNTAKALWPGAPVIFFVVGGEKDRSAAAYTDNDGAGFVAAETALYAGLRADTASPEARFVTVLLGTDTGNNPDAIRTAQRAVVDADPFAALVGTTDLTFFDNLHYDAISLKRIGIRSVGAAAQAWRGI